MSLKSVHHNVSLNYGRNNCEFKKNTIKSIIHRSLNISLCRDE